MQSLWQDLRYGARMLWKNPGFTLIVVLTLALGIGANTAIFSVVNAVLLRPLPGIKAPTQLAALDRTKGGTAEPFGGGHSYPDFRDYRDQNKIFSGLLAFRSASVDLSNGAETKRIQGMVVSSNYFTVLDVNPVLGRTFLPEEDRTPNSYPVTILGFELWQRSFSADPNIVGKLVTLNGRGFTVVGIAPKGFRGTDLLEPCEIWAPLAMYAQVMPNVLASFADRDIRWLSIIGRLKPELSFEQAQAELNVLARQLALAYPKGNEEGGVRLARPIGLEPWLREGGRDYLGLLMAVVGLVLLIACANVANLLLARATTQQKEIAIRLTLGASRARLIRQLLTESMLLSLLGGALGLCVTWWTADLLLAYLHTEEFLALNTSPDARVLGFTLLIAIFSGIAFGLLPALQSSKSDLTVALKEGATKRAYSKSRLRNLLVILQVSLSLVLLIGTGLLVKTLRNLWQSNPISEPERLLLMSVQPSLQQYNDAKQNELYRQLLERIALIPGVKSVSLAGGWSIADSSFFKEEALIEGREASGKQTSLSYKVVAPNYFQTMGTALLRGRDFSMQDREGAPGVIVINETLARRCWPNEDPIGKQLKLFGENSHREVIGLAKDRKWDEEAQPFMYLPLFQKYPWSASEMTLHIRTAVAPKSLIAAVRNEVQAVDYQLPIINIRTLAEFINEELGIQRMAVIIIGLSGLLALILASVGLYGLMSYTVLQRTHDIGVRMALGAQARDVLKLVVEQGMKLVLLGVGLGLVGALALTRLLKTLLFCVSATDPLTFVVIALLLVLVALLACYIPARRATKIDLLLAIRDE